MNIVLHKNTSPTNKVDKSIDTGITLEGTLRENTSIVDPEFLVELDFDTADVAELNYLYSEDFGRYYYITNIVHVTDQLWDLQCHVDVLMSFKTEIREQTAVVSRQEMKYNTMLDDGWYMAYQDPLIQIKKFSNETPFETQSFALMVSGC